MRILGYICMFLITLIWFLITYRYFTSGVYEYSYFGSNISWASLLLLVGIFVFGYFWGRIFYKNMHVVSASNIVSTQPHIDFSKVSNNSHILGDDLKVIEGVGPKLEKLLKENKLTTFSAISGSSVQDLERIIESAGNKFAMHNPKTWPEQAKLAQEGKWDELKEYQNFLYRGLDS